MVNNFTDQNYIVDAFNSLEYVFAFLYKLIPYSNIKIAFLNRIYSVYEIK